MKYKVNFEGFVCVDADNPDEAVQKVFFDDDILNCELVNIDIEEVDDFEVEI